MAHGDQRHTRNIPELGEVPLRYFDGGQRLTDKSLARILNQLGQLFIGGAGPGEGGLFDIGLARSWHFQTNDTIGYAGGFYDHAPADNDFSPAITFGNVNVPHSAHLFIVTGAVTTDELTIRATGTNITDEGIRTPGYAQDVVIPAGTPANSYFEFKKFIGQITIEAISGTPVACNYGWVKYYDANNQDFWVVGLECLWQSDATDAASDIELIHHRKEGWTFNPGSSADPPAPIASRSADLSPENTNHVGEMAWKRTNLETLVRGGDTEGILFRVTSGSTGIGSLSYRGLDLELTIRPSII